MLEFLQSLNAMQFNTLLILILTGVAGLIFCWVKSVIHNTLKDFKQMRTEMHKNIVHQDKVQTQVKSIYDSLHDIRADINIIMESLTNRQERGIRTRKGDRQ